MTDDITKLWARNESDERAIANGCRFDLERAAYAVWWIERHCNLYEGEWAGTPLILRGVHGETQERIVEPFYDGDDYGPGAELSIKRAMEYSEAFSGGADVDWQYECTMRFFGWVKKSERWGREVRRFVKSLIGVGKKNKKTPTEAAWGLYLLAGDGEQGQKVFLGAKDGTQAGIAADHAIAMVEASPELIAECKINKNEKRIAHHPTQSYMKPLSSSDSRSKQSKEGLNGSMLVDEIHVVDDEFMQRTKRMGISRSEPVIAQFSTAGMNPEGYGKAQWDYARDIMEGRANNDGYFAAIYEAPADLTDEALAEDPIRWGKMANPAWGHTVGVEEYLADYEESNAKVADLASFKYQRLNIWQSSSNPWKIAGHWAKCKSSQTLADFIGQPCWLGADLSRARDMSALVATFRDEEQDPAHYYQFAWCWMVREYAEKHRDKAPFAQWEHDGHLVMCDGTIDLRLIEEQVKAINDAHRVQEFRHDPAYANELAQRLEDESGVLSVPFKQAIMDYAKPFDDFEAAVIDGVLHHDGDPVYNWQVGNAYIKSAPNNPDTKRVVKEASDSVKKVDIVQAGIMSLSGAMAAESGRSVYETRGPISVRA